jgi:nitrilase
MKYDESSFKAASVQTAPVFLNKKSSTEKACELILEAGKNGVKLIVFPEAFVSGYPDWVWLVPAGQKAVINEMYRELWSSAVTVPDESTGRLCKAAKDASAYVAIGINERNNEASNASIFNTLLYIDRSGKILGKHRKLIPTGGERLMWSPGDGSTLVSYDTKLGKLGGLICWENYMPLARNAMYTAGVQLYVAPTWDSSDSWLTAMRHIAREGGMYVMGCAPAMKITDIPDKYEYKKLYPDDRDWINKGNSCIVNPKGEFIAGPLSSSQEILYADIELSLIQDQKWMFDVAGHYARPDVFNYCINRQSTD